VHINITTMNKYSIAERVEVDIAYPVLYKIEIGKKYYLHKGKRLEDSLNKFLDDLFRGVRANEYKGVLHKAVDYCKKYPAIHKVSVNVVFNGNAEELLALEDKIYLEMATDDNSLNDTNIPPYKPEWMLKTFIKRCAKCPSVGIVYGEEMVFNYCPKCSHKIK